MLTPDDIARYDNIFEKLKDQPTSLSGGCAKEKWAAVRSTCRSTASLCT